MASRYAGRVSGPVVTAQRALERFSTCLPTRALTLSDDPRAKFSPSPSPRRSAEPSYETVSPLLCPSLKNCSLSVNDCPFGFQQDNNGCLLCQCLSSKCNFPSPLHVPALAASRGFSH